MYVSRTTLSVLLSCFVGIITSCNSANKARRPGARQGNFSETKNTLLIINHQHANLINLNGNTCSLSSPVAPFPKELHAVNGFTLNGTLFACGGQIVDDRARIKPSRDCYKYNKVDNEWIFLNYVMAEGRYHFPSINYNRTHQLFIGGTGPRGFAMSSLELFNGAKSARFGLLSHDTEEYSSFSLLFNGERSRSGSCAVKLNDTHVFIAGGFPVERLAEIYKMGENGLEKTWEMRMDHDWSFHVCGMVKNSQGETEIVLSKGITNIVNIPNKVIRKGPSLPDHKGNSIAPRYFQYQDSFLVVSGPDCSGVHCGNKFVSQFINGEYVKVEEFGVEGYVSGVFLVEDDLFNC